MTHSSTLIETLTPPIQELANAFWPPACLSCDALGQSPFCLPCENALLHAESSPQQNTHHHLGSLWLYGGPLSLAFAKTKFSKQPHQMKKLLSWLVQQGFLEKHRDLFQQHPWDAISWVPAHPYRRLQRGFNAAQLLAIILGKRMRLPLFSSLKCVRNDAPFSLGSSKAVRQKNIQGRYLAHNKARKRKILLVDDICTTGATLGEASKQLAQAGSAVHTFTLAQTPKNN